MRFRLWLRTGIRDWKNYVPIVPILSGYQRSDFSHDAVAGLVVGMVTIPQAVAYAQLAGMPPQAGLYACLVPMVLYAVFGSSRQMVVGPVAVSALLVAATVSQHAPKYSESYAALTIILCLQVGLMLWLLRLSRMGGLINLLSHPVITGFVNAAAILIIVSQLPTFLGLELDNSGTPVDVVSQVVAGLAATNMATFQLGIGALIVLLVLPSAILGITRILGRPISPTHALTRLGPMAVAILGIAAVYAFDLIGKVATIGHVPPGLPEITIPSLTMDNVAIWLDMLPAAGVIALVAYVESYSIGMTLAVRQNSRVNSHQELIAMGAANIGAAFTGAYPVAGSFSRSSVNYYAGARTPVSSFVCALIIVVVLLFFTQVFTHLPNGVLAAIVMLSVVGLMDLKNGPHHWKFHREDTITEYATMILVLFMGIETGLLVGVGLSIAFFIRTSSRPNITQWDVWATASCFAPSNATMSKHCPTYWLCA